MTISETHASHIRRVKVEFVVSGAELGPAAMTKTLGMPPSHAAKRGDPRVNGMGVVTGEEPKGIWCFDSTPEIDSKDINEHFEYLLSLFLPRAESFKGFETFFDVLWESTYLYAGTGPVLSPRNCNGIGRLGAGIGFDIYQVDEDD